MVKSIKLLFRGIRDWAEDIPNDGYEDIFGSSTGKQEKDYEDIFGSTGKQEKDYEDIFGSTGKQECDYGDAGKSAAGAGTMENPVDKLTFEDVTGFYFDMHEKKGNINKCMLHFVEKKTVKVKGYMVYCIDQYFLDKAGRVLYSADNPRKRLGRTVYAKTLDEGLMNSFKRKNPFEL